MKEKHVALIHSGNEYMKLYADGGIQRASGHGPNASTWRITGAARLNNFGYVVERFTLKDVLSGMIQWKHKNGKQRVHLIDYDHGTGRLWGSPEHEVMKA